MFSVSYPSCKVWVRGVRRGMFGQARRCDRQAGIVVVQTMSRTGGKGERVNQSTVLDIFAGIGGLSEGFLSAGCEVLGAVEWDSQMARCYELRHSRYRPQPSVFKEDIRSLNPTRLLRELKLEPEQLTYLIGGSPCQGFSSIGQRRTDDERNALIFEFVRFLQVFKSEAFLIENVPGLLEPGRSDVLNHLVDGLSGAGYANVRYQLVDAAACGVPQRRVRVVIYGTRTAPLPDYQDLAIADGTGPTVWDALRDLPDPLKVAKRFKPGSRVPYNSTPPSEYGKLLRASARTVSHWEPVAHSGTIVSAYAKLEQGETEPSTKCWRLIADGYARTLRAGSRTRTACRPVHPFDPRVITVREAARLHSFADSHPLPLAKSSAHVGIGNAVPPFMARALAKAFCEALSGRTGERDAPEAVNDQAA